MAKMALTYDGVDDILNCGSAASLDDVNDFTWQFWMYWRSIPVFPDNYSYVMSKGGVKRLGLYWQLGYFGYIVCATTAAIRTTPNNVIPLNKWIYVGMDYDGSATKTIHFYQNVVEVLGGVTTPGVGAEVSDAASDLVLGFLVEDYFDGIIAEPLLHNRVLSDHERLQCMKGLPVPEGLVLHFDFWGPRGSDGTDRVRDLSPYGNHGTNGGGVAAQMAKQVPLPDFPPLWKQGKHVNI